MIVICEAVESLLGLGEALPVSAQAHALKCNACSALSADYEDLDAILATEPTPAAPLDLASSVMRILAERRLEELRQVRLQVLVAVAAAALLAVAVAFGLPPEGSGAQVWLPDPSVSLAHARGLVESLRMEVVAGVVATLDALPSPPLLLVALLAPCLLVFNWSLCRGRPHGAVAVL